MISDIVVINNEIEIITVSKYLNYVNISITLYVHYFIKKLNQVLIKFVPKYFLI